LTIVSPLEIPVPGIGNRQNDASKCAIAQEARCRVEVGNLQIAPALFAAARSLAQPRCRQRLESRTNRMRAVSRKVQRIRDLLAIRENFSRMQ
jgi:hypothetical protein